jgi:hypothetical protein
LQRAKLTGEMASRHLIIDLIAAVVDPPAE